MAWEAEPALTTKQGLKKLRKTVSPNKIQKRAGDVAQGLSTRGFNPWYKIERIKIVQKQKNRLVQSSNLVILGSFYIFPTT